MLFPPPPPELEFRYRVPPIPVVDKTESVCSPDENTVLAENVPPADEMPALNLVTALNVPPAAQTPADTFSVPVTVAKPPLGRSV